MFTTTYHTQPVRVVKNGAETLFSVKNNEIKCQKCNCFFCYLFLFYRKATCSASASAEFLQQLLT